MYLGIFELHTEFIFTIHRRYGDMLRILSRGVHRIKIISISMMFWNEITITFTQTVLCISIYCIMYTLATAISSIQTL